MKIPLKNTLAYLSGASPMKLFMAILTIPNKAGVFVNFSSFHSRLINWAWLGAHPSFWQSFSFLLENIKIGMEITVGDNHTSLLRYNFSRKKAL